MNVRETEGRDRNLLWRKVGMVVDLTSLASEAGITPGGHITCKVRPNIPKGQEAVLGTNGYVSKAMNMLEKERMKGKRNQRPEN